MSIVQKSDVDIGIVVLSCDKYSDLWPIFFERFFKEWPNCEYPVYLFANEEIFIHDKVTTLLSIKDPDWSFSVKTCLQQIRHEYVWVLFDDVFIDKKVNRTKIQKLINFISDEKPDYLRFRPTPKPDERYTVDFGRYYEKTLYRTAVFGIWKREVLVGLLQEGESAWDFEYNSVKRASHLSSFYGVYEEYFSYIHGVEKGIWLTDAVKKLEGLDIRPDFSKRRQMSKQEYNERKWTVMREYIFNKSPAFLRPFLLKAQKIKRKLIESI